MKHQSVAIVVVTYNRADLLRGMLASLEEQTRPADAIYVVDNASTDNTQAVLRDFGHLPLHVTRSAQNTGGAGGFHVGLRTAFEDGHDCFWLMDDDVRPAAQCLERLLEAGHECMIATREDSSGHLVEKAAIEFDLSNVFVLHPKRSTIDSTYALRQDMPSAVEVETVAFEGFYCTREVVTRVGMPDPAYFIFSDDTDYAIRARARGFKIYAIRDAVLVRQLPFDQSDALASWKGFYMYRNMFVLHLRWGANPIVRAKPFLFAISAALRSLLQGNPRRARLFLECLSSALRMRELSPEAQPEGARP